MALVSLISAAAYWFAGWFLLRGIKRLTVVEGKSSLRTLSVIIPARNEEKSLPHLLASLRRQRVLPEEIIVVDDASDDGTAEIARQAGCTVISLTGKPESWTGKSWACWNGAGAASSQLLLFLDADVWCGENAVQFLISSYEKHGGLISVQPKHQARQLYEQISAFFNIVAVAAAGKRGGFGPCMVCSREEYFACGGHEAIRSHVVEDFALAKLFSDNGQDITPFLGGEELTFRMYPGGLGELYEGWTKNMAAGLPMSNPLSVVLIFIWFTGIINVVLSIAGGAHSSQLLLIAGSTLVYLLYVIQVSILLARVGRFRLSTSLFFPIFLGFFLLFFAISAILTAVIGKVRWKGRIIPLR